jgi:hypothetical protein
MTTTTPILKTHPHSRRFVTIALAFGAGAALGVAGTARGIVKSCGWIPFVDHAAT